MTLLNDSYLIFPADYGAPSLNVTGYWIKGNWWNEDGASVLGGRTLTTYGSTPINIPFEIKTEGNYEIWIRVGYAPNRGKMLASIDSLPIDEITPESGFWSGLKWVNLTPSFHLETGSHIITLTNDGTGYNDVDAIAIAPQGQVDYQRSGMLDLLGAFHGKILYLIEAEEAFSEKVPRGWSIRTYPNKGEGYVLHMENCFSISPEAKASASSTSSGHEAQNAIDGDFNTRWASSSGMPQWLEMNWPTPQELLGLGINFENAIAKDYRIQTWNGTQWIDQVSVENNSLLFRSHKFPEPVTTDKVRILVTSAPAFDVVSIFEVEAYSTSKMVSSKILIPRKGEYSFSARMIQDENANGTLFLKVDDRLFSAYSPTSPINETEFSWQQLGSTYLDIGEHNVSISAVGNVDLDQIGVYSSENDTSSLAELFGSSLSSPYTSYVKISPCEYHVHVNCTKPFLLVFSESYNPLWKAYFDDKEVSPIVADSLVNGFFINRTGEFDVTLYFTGQKYADLGLMISGGSAIFIIISVLAKFILPKRFRHVSIKLKKKEGFAN